MAAAEPPAPPPAILYVDTSALLKLLVRESESAVIERELLTWGDLATSVITEVELPRAVERAREERADAVINGSVVLQGVLSSAAIVPLNEDVVAEARKVQPIHVGALDAIHVASALSLGKQLAGVATYDNRMQDALERLGIRVIAPADPTPNPPTADTPPSTTRARRSALARDDCSTQRLPEQLGEGLSQLPDDAIFVVIGAPPRCPSSRSSWSSVFGDAVQVSNGPSRESIPQCPAGSL